GYLSPVEFERKVGLAYPGVHQTGSSLNLEAGSEASATKDDESSQGGVPVVILLRHLQAPEGHKD
ncbi:hypothetical protein, partial [Bradyrhizobium sp. CCBAU 53380]|uniref:hypothetical protein n=1 Tax=Bradyrhizobium sp. CCBAU 53380 TaxID=1325117 RepID=UPI0023035E00